MGTTWSARVIAPPGLDQATIRSAIQAECDAVVALFSPWEPDSEISGFNTAPPGPVALSPPFWALLSEALDLADMTDGAVDPTLGALVDLWGFGPPGPRDGGPGASGPPVLPTDAEIETALSASGWRGLRLDAAVGQAIQTAPPIRLDLSAIAKGHAVDRVSDRLMTLGATSHLVEIGGELKGRGVKPDARPWWVEIEQPPSDGTGAPPLPRSVVALVDLAVATSGDYRRAFVLGERLFPHTIDGRTGRPVDNGLTSVTVLHASALQADALSTALTVMGPYDGPEFAESLGLAAHFVQRTPRGLTERMTPAWADMLDEDGG